MKSRSWLLTLSGLLLLSAGILLALIAAGSGAQAGSPDDPAAERASAPSTEAARPAPAATSLVAAPLEDRGLELFRTELLELAFHAASKLPLLPHVKTRSRAQEAVVTTCLELDQPRRARVYMEELANWRRGAAYADLASYCAERGDVDSAEEYLRLALRVSEELDQGLAAESEGQYDDEAVEGLQDWRRDRIRAKVARAYYLLGQSARAAELEAGLEESERGPVLAVKALRDAPDSFDAELAFVATVAGSGDLDQTRNALAAGVALLPRVHADEERRARLEAALEACMERMPADLKIHTLTALAEAALQLGDRGRALAWTRAAQLAFGSSTWSPEDGVVLQAGLARLRQGVGDAEGARSEADAALQTFDSARESIADMFRAETLVPLAEAYQELGDTRTALELYRRAVEEGAGNPNARPRAEDLSATCLSMARHGVEPDAELWRRVVQIGEGLGDPW